jgi:hypothetical protein
MYRHAKRRDHVIIGRLNIFRLLKDKGCNTFEFVEIINLNSKNYHFLDDDCGNTSLDVSERYKSA